MFYRDPGQPGGYPAGGANSGFPVILQKYTPDCVADKSFSL
jgi:hypothetical protein